MISANDQNIKAYHWILFTICFLGTVFAGISSTLMSVYLPVSVKDFLGNMSDNDFNNISGFINAIFIFGAAAGGLTIGMIADRMGRKLAVIISIACYSIFTLLTGFMEHWWMIVICRFFTGCGMGAILVSTMTIMVEEWPQKTRSVLMGILSIAIPVGIFSAGVIDYFVSSWRQAFLVGALPLLIAILSHWLLRESPKWRADKEAVNLKQKAPDRLFSPDYRIDLINGSIIFGTMLIGLWAVFSWIPTWIQSLITDEDGQKERGISMMMLGMGGLIGGFVSGWVSDRIGLRRSMLLCFSVCAVLSLLLFKTNSNFSAIIHVEILILAFFFGLSQGVLAVYIPQLFPVAVRGRATGFCFNAGRLFTATAVLFVGVLVMELGGYSNSLFVFSSVFLIGLVVTFFSKEKIYSADLDLASENLLTNEKVKAGERDLP